MMLKFLRREFHQSSQLWKSKGKPLPIKNPSKKVRNTECSVISLKAPAPASKSANNTKKYYPKLVPLVNSRIPPRVETAQLVSKLNSILLGDSKKMEGSLQIPKDFLYTDQIDFTEQSLKKMFQSYQLRQILTKSGISVSKQTSKRRVIEMILDHRKQRFIKEQRILSKVIALNAKSDRFLFQQVSSKLSLLYNVEIDTSVESEQVPSSVTIKGTILNLEKFLKSFQEHKNRLKSETYKPEKKFDLEKIDFLERTTPVSIQQNEDSSIRVTAFNGKALSEAKSRLEELLNPRNIRETFIRSVDTNCPVVLFPVQDMSMSAFHRQLNHLRPAQVVNRKLVSESEENENLLVKKAEEFFGQNLEKHSSISLIVGRLGFWTEPGQGNQIPLATYPLDNMEQLLKEKFHYNFFDLGSSLPLSQFMKSKDSFFDQITTHETIYRPVLKSGSSDEKFLRVSYQNFMDSSIPKLTCAEIVDGDPGKDFPIINVNRSKDYILRVNNSKSISSPDIPRSLPDPASLPFHLEIDNIKFEKDQSYQLVSDIYRVNDDSKILIKVSVNPAKKLEKRIELIREETSGHDDGWLCLIEAADKFNPLLYN